MDRSCLITSDADAKVADAPDRETGTGEVGFGKGDIRQRELKIGTVLDLLGLQRLLGKCGNRNWNVLNALRLTLCGNDNDIVIDGTVLPVLCHGRYGHCRYSGGG